MTTTYTIESADDSAPIAPGQLRQLRDLLREDEDLDLGVRLRDRPPAPGEQGAIPIALEIVAAVTPLGPAFAAVLIHWMDRNRVSLAVKVSRGARSVKLSTGCRRDAEQLLATLEKALGEGSGHAS